MGGRARSMALIAACALALAPAGLAQTPAPVLQPAQIALADQFDVASKITGRTYRIYVSRPAAAPPKSGYAVVYVLDGDSNFAIAARQIGRAPAPPVLVVGIAYPDAARSSVLRQRDFTPYQPDAATQRLAADGRTPNDFGGADDFHRFMIEELRPLIARLHPVDPRQQSLMGYSLGGLFALHTMFRHPDAYQSLVIGSPSIWWNGGQVLADEAAFAAAVQAGTTAPRILITSQQWEQGDGDGDPSLPAPGPERAQRVKQLSGLKMIDNARGLADRLKALKGAPGYEVQYFVFAQENHSTGTPAATSRGANFLYPH